MEAVIDKISNDLFKSRFEHELKFLEEEHSSDDRLNYVKNVLKQLNHKNVANQEQEDTKDRFSDVEQLMYQKKWRQLNNVHKVIKIREYLKILIEDTNNRKTVEKVLVSMVENRKLNSDKIVIYDTVRGKVEDITILKHDDEEDTYKVGK